MKTRLKEFRKMAGYSSADEFAEKMGMSVHTYRKYEQGVIDLYLDTACEFADEFGCTLEELIGRKPANGTGEFLTKDERFILEAYRNGDYLTRMLFEKVAESEKSRIEAGGGQHEGRVA